MRFNSEIVSATIEAGTLYIYDDELGYLLDARSGEPEEDFLLIDNYGGLTETDRPSSRALRPVIGTGRRRPSNHPGKWTGR